MCGPLQSYKAEAALLRQQLRDAGFYVRDVNELELPEALQHLARFVRSAKTSATGPEAADENPAGAHAGRLTVCVVFRARCFQWRVEKTYRTADAICFLCMVSNKSARENTGAAASVACRRCEHLSLVGRGMRARQGITRAASRAFECRHMHESIWKSYRMLVVSVLMCLQAQQHAQPLLQRPVMSTIGMLLTRKR